MDDDDLPGPAELEQLARSLAMDGSLGRRDAQRVAEVLRRAAVWRCDRTCCPRWVGRCPGGP